MSAQEQEFVEEVDEEVEEDLSSDPELAQVLAHMTSLKGKVAVEDLDFLLERMRAKDIEIKELAKLAKRQNKIMMRMKFIATGVLKDLARGDYKGPYGTIKIKSTVQIRMPSDPEAKGELWAWMREKGIFDRYATVQANSLKALVEAEMEIAEKELGADFDPVTFALPGMAPATFFEDLKFTPAKR